MPAVVPSERQSCVPRTGSGGEGTRACLGRRRTDARWRSLRGSDPSAGARSLAGVLSVTQGSASPVVAAVEAELAVQQPVAVVHEGAEHVDRLARFRPWCHLSSRSRTAHRPAVPHRPAEHHLVAENARGARERSDRTGIDVEEEPSAGGGAVRIQGSHPCTPSSAVKYNAPGRGCSARWDSTRRTGLMSRSCAVPPGVPSVDHSSWPALNIDAVKYRRPLKAVSEHGFAAPFPPIGSIAFAVPAGAVGAPQRRALAETQPGKKIVAQSDEAIDRADGNVRRLEQRSRADRSERLEALRSTTELHQPRSAAGIGREEIQRAIDHLQVRRRVAVPGLMSARRRAPGCRAIRSPQPATAAGIRGGEDKLPFEPG